MNDLPVRWEWDDNKNEQNRRKHGISFQLAERVFDDPLHASQPDPFRTEQRWRTIGEIRDDVVIIVIHTKPEPDYIRGEAVGRIISARKADGRERNAYAAGEL